MKNCFDDEFLYWRMESLHKICARTKQKHYTIFNEVNMTLWYFRAKKLW